MNQSYPDAVAVFCGSNSGNQPVFAHAAKSLGIAIAESGLDFVYGGGCEGLMGISSRAALQAGAKVIGVIPYAMVDDGKALHHVSGYSVLLDEHHSGEQTIVVNSMHERKVEMAKRVRGFFGLPGGFGTFEELLEMITWTQLNIHSKPIVILNVLGFYNPLRDLIKTGIRSNFIKPEGEGLVVFIDGPSEVQEHGTYDWGTAALDAVSSWRRPQRQLTRVRYEWNKRFEGEPPDTLQVS